MWKHSGVRIPTLALGGLVALSVGVWAFLPWPARLQTRNPDTTSLILYRQQQAQERGERLDVRQTWVPLNQVSRHLRQAVLVAEDYRFNSHGGIDWEALAEEAHYQGDPLFSLTDPGDVRSLLQAGRYVWVHRRELRGRSTITQQLAKNLYFTPERSISRKVKELVVARRLERFLTKDRILELYLNVVELGPGIFGAEAAARAYFGVPTRDLTLRQAATLAATLPHPLTSNPGYRPRRMAWRRNLIVERILGRRRGEPPAPLPLPEIEVPAPEIQITDPGLLPVIDPQVVPRPNSLEADSLRPDSTTKRRRPPSEFARS